MTNRDILYTLRAALAGGKTARAQDIALTLDGVTEDNVQDYLQILGGDVQTLQNTAFNSGRSFITFTDGFTIDRNNISTYEDINSIYAAKNNKPFTSDTRPDIILPSDTEIQASGETYPITFEFTHLGGTAKTTDSNVVRFYLEGNLLHSLTRDSVVVITKPAVGEAYVFLSSIFNPNDTILPSGVFNLKTDTSISDISAIATELGAVTIIAGDAYLVETGGVWSGLGVPDNSVLVALVSSASLVDSVTNNDWLLLDGGRINFETAMFLANWAQDSVQFTANRNVRIDASNVLEVASEATGVPLVRDIGTNTQGSKSIRYNAVPLALPTLTPGRLELAVQVDTGVSSGSLPVLTSVVLEIGSATFTFPLSNVEFGSEAIIGVDVPVADYSDLTTNLVFNYEFTGVSYSGTVTINGLVNTTTGTLHDAILSLVNTSSTTLRNELIARINTVLGSIDPGNESLAAIQDRISPYRTNTLQAPNIHTRYLASTGSDAFPLISAMSEVNPDNPVFTLTSTDVFVGIPVGGANALLDTATGTPTVLDASTSGVDLGESATLEGISYFVYRVSGQTIGAVVQVVQVTDVQVVAWAADIEELESDIIRIDTELKHAALDLDDALVQVLENEVSVTEEASPSVVPTKYNESLGTTGSGVVLYETAPGTTSGGIRPSELISLGNKKLVYLPVTQSHPSFVLRANNGTTTTDLINYNNGTFYANQFVPAAASGSTTVTITPAPATQLASEWYALSLKSSTLQATATELFLTRDVPTTQTVLDVQYRYDDNGNHGPTQTTSLLIGVITQSVSQAVTLNLPDGETVDVVIEWDAVRRQIKLSANPNANNVNRFIFDMEIGVTYTETRVIPATPESVRMVELSQEGLEDNYNVFAIKEGTGDAIILVGNESEVNTGYTFTSLLSTTGSFEIDTLSGTYLNYVGINPATSLIPQLEAHAILPQFGLFTTQYTHETVVALATQLSVLDVKGDVYNLGDVVAELLERVTALDGG